MDLRFMFQTKARSHYRAAFEDEDGSALVRHTLLIGVYAAGKASVEDGTLDLAHKNLSDLQ
jgi:hypothetical protein